MDQLKLFDFFKDTVLMLANNEADIKLKSTTGNLSRQAIVEDYLREIEGDAYTFLHPDNIKQLEDVGLISNEVFELSLKLRELVEAMPKELWTAKAYDETEEWKTIHQLADQIINNL